MNVAGWERSVASGQAPLLQLSVDKRLAMATLPCRSQMTHFPHPRRSGRKRAAGRRRAPGNRPPLRPARGSSLRRRKPRQLRGDPPSARRGAPAAYPSWAPGQNLAGSTVPTATLVLSNTLCSFRPPLPVARASSVLTEGGT